MPSSDEYDVMFQSLGTSLYDVQKRIGIPTEEDMDEMMREQFRKLGYKVQQINSEEDNK